MNSPDDKIPQYLRLVARLCALTTLLLALATFAGWATHWRLLENLNERFLPMAPNTALSFLATSAGLLLTLMRGRERWREFAVWALAGAVMLLAGARLVETAGQLDLGLDRWLFYFSAAGSETAPMEKMNPISAGCFVCASLVLLLLSAPPSRPRLTDGVAVMLGVVIAVVSLTFTLGYLYRRPMLSGRRLIPLALSTTLAFDFLGPGLLIASMLRDIVERRASHRRQSAQHAVTRVLAEGGSLAEAGPRLLEALCQSLHWQFGALWSRNRAAGVLCCIATWRTAGVEVDELESLSRKLPCARGVRMPGRVWASGKPEWLTRFRTGPEHPRAVAALHAGLRGAFAVPVLQDTECLGAIEFFHQDNPEPDPELLEMMTAVASQIALFMQRKQSAEELAREHNLLRAIIDNLPDHIYLKDLAGRYIMDNAAHSRFLGLSTPEQIVGKTVFDLLPKEVAEKFTADDQRVLKSNQPLINREEEIIQHEGGRHWWVVTTKLPFRDDDGRLVGLVCVSRDITAQKETEEELRVAQLQVIQAEKLESLGRLAASIAHEVKNPLAMLLMGVEFLTSEQEDAPAPNPAVSEVLQTMRESVQRADSIVREMLDFSSPKPLSLLPMDINSVLTGTLPLVRHDLDAAGVRFEGEFTDGLPLVPLDRDKIKQVFINLFTNAVHAMPDGGKLMVRTTAVVPGPHADNGAGEGGSGGVPGSGAPDGRAEEFAVLVKIEDTGTGFPPDKLTAVFDPFFTTKPTGKGTGLGLSVTKKIIELHGGEIRVHNRPEGGACVALRFKAAAAEPAPAPALAEPV